MSDVDPAPLADDEPARRRPRIGGRRVLALGLVLALAGGGAAAAVVLTRGDGGEPAAAPVTAAPPPPAAPAPAPPAAPAQTAPAVTEPTPGTATDDAPAGAWALSRAVRKGVPTSAAVTRAAPGQRLVALTFDDGPGADTAAVLDALARGDAHATFFVLGRRIGGNEGLLRREVADGHAVGNHSWLHPDMRKLTDAKRHQQLSDTDVAIRQATGERPTLFRPPYGATNPDVNVLARRLGLLPVVWSADTRDWAGLKARQIARRALAGARPGAIILLHDGGGDRRETVKAIPLILAGLAERGLVPVTLPELLNASPPGAPGTLARTQGRRSY